MTLEELQVEATKFGYKLVKISEQKYIPLKPCPVCGEKNTSVWYGNFGMIRSLDLLLYYHKRMTGQIAKAEKDLHKAINARNKVLSEYYALCRECDDGEGCITISTLRDKLDEVHDSCIELKKVLTTIGKQTNFYNTVR